MTQMVSPTETGGSPIISYSLEWDDASGQLFFTPLFGDVENNIQLLYTKTGLTAGVAYSFKYRVRNIYGWSTYSAVKTQISARVPDAPAAPVTVNSLTSISISWEEPYNGGSSLLSYKLVIRASTGNFLVEPTYCNAEFDQTVFINRLCVIPMAALQDSPFLLAQTDEVVAKVLATNIIGDSAYSEDSSQRPGIGAVIQTVPLKPPTPPSRGPLTTTTSI